MIHAFIYGLILTFGLIIPLGVQNIFIFNQGATQRHFLQAMPSVVAAALCDTLLIIISILGVSVIVLTIPWLKTTFFIIGFFFLMTMGWLTWKSHPEKLNSTENPCSIKRQIGFSVSVSLLNPHALLDTISVIGTNAVQFAGHEKIAYTLACITVSWTWFFSLSIAGHFLHRIDKTGFGIRLVNKISAIVIWAVAMYIAQQIIKSS